MILTNRPCALLAKEILTEFVLLSFDIPLNSSVDGIFLSVQNASANFTASRNHILGNEAFAAMEPLLKL